MKRRSTRSSPSAYLPFAFRPCQKLHRYHVMEFSDSPHLHPRPQPDPDTRSILCTPFASTLLPQCKTLVKRRMPMPGPRSRQGCDECRKRRRKCDEQKPRCGHCISFSRTCEYPLRVVWQVGKRSSISGLILCGRVRVWTVPTDPSRSPTRDRKHGRIGTTPSDKGPPKIPPQRHTALPALPTPARPLYPRHPRLAVMPPVHPP